MNPEFSPSMVGATSTLPDHEKVVPSISSDLSILGMFRVMVTVLPCVPKGMISRVALVPSNVAVGSPVVPPCIITKASKGVATL